MTKAAGMGPVSEILEASAGTRAVTRAFRAANLPPELASEPGRELPLASLVRLFDNSARESGDRCLGLRVGQNMSHLNFGLWVDYSACAPILGDALRRIEHSIGFFQSGAAFVLRADKDGIYWGYQRPFRRDRGRQHADHTLPPMIGFLREYLGDDWMPEHVRVCYRRDPGAQLVEQALGTAIRFDAPCIAVPLKSSDLLAPRRRPVTISDRVTFADLLANTAAHPDGSASSAVRHILGLRLLQGKTDIEGTAQMAGIGPRSLQRQLRSEGASYRRIVEQMRVQRSIGLMQESEDSIADIAIALGYSEPGNFTRAFRRVTGMPPIEFRRRADG